MLIVSLGEGVQGFTLDSASQEFYLTHRIQIPARGMPVACFTLKVFHVQPA